MHINYIFFHKSFNIINDIDNTKLYRRSVWHTASMYTISIKYPANSVGNSVRIQYNRYLSVRSWLCQNIVRVICSIDLINIFDEFSFRSASIRFRHFVDIYWSVNCSCQRFMSSYIVIDHLDADISPTSMRTFEWNRYTMRDMVELILIFLLYLYTGH